MAGRRTLIFPAPAALAACSGGEQQEAKRRLTLKSVGADQRLLVTNTNNFTPSQTPMRKRCSFPLR